MDKIGVAAVFAAVLILTVGFAYAIPGFRGMGAGNGNGFGAVEGSTANPDAIPGYGKAFRAGNADCRYADNSEHRESFRQAVLDNDFATAKSLREQYGFGGAMFDKLDETSFSKLSQIAKLSAELREELGLPEDERAGIGLGFGKCHFFGRGRMVQQAAAQETQ